MGGRAGDGLMLFISFKVTKSRFYRATGVTDYTSKFQTVSASAGLRIRTFSLMKFYGIIPPCPCTKHKIMFIYLTGTIILHNYHFDLLRT